MRSILTRLILLLVVAGVAGMGYYVIQRLPERKVEIPSVQVKRGDLIVRTFVRGELRAVRSVLLTAPNLGASTPVTRLAAPGALAQHKDLIVEFDDAELQASLEEAQLEVEQVEERLRKAEADLQIRRNQDQVDLLRARYAVRRAELEVKRNELISAIDARKNELTLEEAKRSLAKLQEDIKSRIEQGEAELAVLREQRRRQLLDANRVRTRMAQTRLLSPMTGLVSIHENRSGNFNFGQQAPELREGDSVSPGTPIAEILDLSEMEVMARVNELERANLHEGQEVLLRLDALPGQTVRGKIKSLSGTASANVFSADPSKKFDCFLSVDMKELLGYVGATPQQIQRVLATAAENAKQFQSGSFSAGLAAGEEPASGESSPGVGGDEGRGAGGVRAGGRRAGADGPPASVRGAPNGGQRAARTGAGGGGPEASGPGRGARNLQNLSPEERQKMIEQFRQRGGEGFAGRRREGGPGGAEAPQLPVPGLPGGAGAMPDLASLSLRQATFQGFTAEDREQAQLPAPPGEHSMADVLLRPGLLAEAEIIVEKIPNALYVPQQAVFEKAGRQIVYVLTGDRFEPRPVKLGRRTESQVAVLEGVNENDTVAMIDMEEVRTQPKKEKKGGKTKQQPGLPGPQAGLAPAQGERS